MAPAGTDTPDFGFFLFLIRRNSRLLQERGTCILSAATCLAVATAVLFPGTADSAD